MQDDTQVPIIQAAYKLTVEVQRYLLLCPKSLRYQMGDRLGLMTQDFFVHTVRSNYERDLAARSRLLEVLSADLLLIRMWLRMLKELKGLAHGHHAPLNLLVEDIQRQLTAWSQWTRS